MDKLTEEHKRKIGESRKRGASFICEVCSKEFWRKPSAIAKGDNKFCSKACYFNWQKGRKRSDEFSEFNVMNTIELFSGTKSFSNVMQKYGHSILTVDMDCSLIPDICADILTMDDSVIPEVDILWASPPCTCFSVASISTNWKYEFGRHFPKTEDAKIGIALVGKTLSIIKNRKPNKWWFIENPRGVLRKMPQMEGMIRHTVSYCQYGDNRMKPTDIWTNAEWWTPRPVCKKGLSCHESAPRGSRTGTQGISSVAERGKIPPELFEEILFQLNGGSPKDGSQMMMSNFRQG
jgi:hypothetical protein